MLDSRMLIRDGMVSATGYAKLSQAANLAVRYNPIVRRQVQATIRRFREADAAQREALSRDLTRRIIARARRTRYGRAFGDDLASWPVLSKQQLRADPRAFRVPGLLRVPADTAGSTGLPLLLQRSLRSIAAEQVFLDDLIAPHGLTWRSARVAVLRSEAFKPIDDDTPPFAKEALGGLRLILSSPHLTAASLDWYIKRLESFRPDILYVYPSALSNLLRLLIQSDRRLHIPLVVATSERLERAVFDAVPHRLGAEVIDYYGLAERSAFAVRRGPDRWFFEPAYGAIELIPTLEDPAAGGQRHVAILATGYWTDGFPLIRYDTGDRAIVAADAGAADLRAIACGEAPFFGIAGRSEEYVFAPDGRRIGALNNFSREVRHLLQLQVVQEAADHIVLRALATPAFGDEDRARLMKNARGKIPGSMRVEIVVTDRLERLPNGKTPSVIRREGCLASAQLPDLPVSHAL